MSLHDIINNLKLDNFTNKNDRSQMYSSIKLISNYIKGEVSKFTKAELKDLIEGLNFYISNKSSGNNKKWNFKSGSIELDSEQHSIIISDIHEHQRIIAGAGSGKTTTILCRVKWLLDNYVCPDRILILTFNRDSAQNIRNRIEDLFGFPVCLNIYTIDAFCCKLMYMYGGINDKISNSNNNDEKLNYNCKINKSNNLNNSNNSNKFNKSNNTSNIKSLSEYSTIGLEIMKLYGKEISNQFTHVFFDEFQDVNDIQFGILKIFTDWGSWLTVIGDDCQNIYQFRGTNNYYMVNFDTIIPNSNTYKLTSNYRSTKIIVNMANDSIGWNKNRVEKKMCSTIKEKSIKPVLAICGSDNDKYEYVIKKIKKLIDIGYGYGDIAILSRNTYPLKCMETELTKNSIPHVALITDKNSDDNKRLLEPNKLALTTIHKSKGLEWSIIIILGLANTHFPEHLNNNIKNIEEERRLFYVGITRCKKYLFMVSSVSEIPLSIFVKEIESYIKISYYHVIKKYSRNELFNSSDTDSTLKLTYGVNELIGSLQSSDYKNLRKKKLIIDSSPKVISVFENQLVWSEKIKKGAFEADFGEFADRYITRGICACLGQDFIDGDTEFIIEQDSNPVDFDEIKNLNSDELAKKFSLKNIPKILTDNDKTKLMLKKMSEQNIIRKFTFPQNVINKIKQCYQKLQNFDISNCMLEEEIYWISLCRNFRLERSRLAYRNIFYIIKENANLSYSKLNPTDTLKSRMEYYIKKYGNKLNIIDSKLPKCKIYLEHKFKNKFKKICMILGELDIIICNNPNPNPNANPNANPNTNKWTLIDFKCSESEFRLEWQLQLLTYYSLIKLLDIYSDIEINQMGIINIMDGKEYYFNIPDDYNFVELIEYWEEKINLDQQSLRPKPNLDLFLPSNIINNTNINLFDSKVNKNKQIIHQIKLKTNKINKNNMLMVLDTETSDFNGDIIQLAYIIVDLDFDYAFNNKNKIIKTVNKIIKDRIPSTSSTKIHNITIDKIRTEGIDFFDVIKEFVEDLSKVNMILGHNTSFDLRIIVNNLRKFSIRVVKEDNLVINNIFEHLDIICTKKLSGGKSLENLHMEFFGHSVLGAHDALNDVNATFNCYLKLFEKQKEEKEKLNKTLNQSDLFV